jgi:hypothetical protein
MNGGAGGDAAWPAIFHRRHPFAEAAIKWHSMWNRSNSVARARETGRDGGTMRRVARRAALPGPTDFQAGKLWPRMFHCDKLEKCDIRHISCGEASMPYSAAIHGAAQFTSPASIIFSPLYPGGTSRSATPISRDGFT